MRSVEVSVDDEPLLSAEELFDDINKRCNECCNPDCDLSMIIGLEESVEHIDPFGSETTTVVLGKESELDVVKVYNGEEIELDVVYNGEESVTDLPVTQANVTDLPVT